MIDELAIRQYRPADKNAVWRVHERAFQAASIPFIPELDRDLRRIPAVYLDGGEFLVGSVAKQIVAIGGFRPLDPGTVEIKRMRVDPRYQRRGYGGALLEALEDRARTSGHGQAVLHTSEYLQAALVFYRKHGYRETNRECHAAADFDLVHFRKSL